MYILLFVLLLVTSCQSDKKEKSTWTPQISMTMDDDPSSLDPRQVRELATVTPLHMLFEGLTRSVGGGRVEPAAALSWEISPDQLTYVFKLREAFWSNGDPLTATDFVATWKSVIDPKFPAPNAYQLNVMKDFHAEDPHTLVVELNAPTPYFLELLATHFYFPVHQSQTFSISNGPFMLHHWKHHNELGVEKNPYYWDKEHVKLHSIAILIVDENTALNMFDQGEVDWVGSPLSNLPQDAITHLKDNGKLSVAPAAGTHLFRINTAFKPMNNAEIRRSFALALNRREIVEHITQGNQAPAFAFVPPSFGMGDNYFGEYSEVEAKALFQKGLDKEGIDKAGFPTLTLSYASNERNHKVAQAVQEQWKKVLGVEIVLDGTESQVFFDKLKRKNYQIAIGSWYADFRDPINFLEVFQYSDNATNNTEWQNPTYVTLLNLSKKELDPKKRNHFLKQAQSVLMEEMPMIPLFHGSYNYLKNEKIKDVHFSDLGYLDFKNASVE